MVTERISVGVNGTGDDATGDLVRSVVMPLHSLKEKMVKSTLKLGGSLLGWTHGSDCN